jgi:hypothetical protein
LEIPDADSRPSYKFFGVKNMMFSPFYRGPYPWEGYRPKRGGGRPRRQRLLFADFALVYRLGKSEDAYEKVAAKHGITVEAVKRQVAREKRWGRLMDAWDRAERKGGILGK